jgi:ABC-type transport system involved in cytochrome bd biosynthesis fused ATPase/permease subunit
MQLLGYLSGAAADSSGSTLVVFLYGGHLVIERVLTLGTFVAFLSYQMRLFPPVQALMGLYASVASARVSLERVNQIFETAPEVREAADAAPLAAARGDVEFDGVSFSFDRSGPVLDTVSFRLRAGETLAIVGPSGSGKSTIADLLLRLLDPDSGVVHPRWLRPARPASLTCAGTFAVRSGAVHFPRLDGENLPATRDRTPLGGDPTCRPRSGVHDFIAGLPQR